MEVFWDGEKVGETAPGSPVMGLRALTRTWDPAKPMCRCPIHHGGDQANADEEDGYCSSCRRNCPKFPPGVILMEAPPS